MENDPDRQGVTGVQDADGLDMWIRKSEEEIRLALEEHDRRRRNLWRPLAWATASTTIFGVLYSFGLRAWTQGVIIVSSSRTDFGTTILIASVVFVVLFVSLARQQQRGTGLSEDSGLLCGECKQPSHANQYMRCSCGGRLEPLNRFDWVSEAERADADVRDQEEPSGHAS